MILWQLKTLEQGFEKKEIVKVLMIDLVNYCVHDVVNLYNKIYKMYYNSNMKKIALIVIALVGSISAFAGDKDVHQTIYQTVYQKNVTQQPSLPKTNQPFYIQQSYSRDYYKTCMAGHEQPITKCRNNGTKNCQSACV